MKVSMIACMLTGILISGTQTYGEGKMLAPGTQAPEFSMVSDKGDTIKLSNYQGKNHVVLIFYPGDQTSGCTKQLCAIRDDYSQFQKKGAVVFGINPADKESHHRFVEKQNYQFPLLVDTDKKVAGLYGTDGIIIQRTVFVIDTRGKIVYAKRGMPPDSEILSAITE
jgi:thioredoxin-dependent peroxiredoxin